MDVSDIFYFFCSGEGKGGVRGDREGGGRICIENARRGGGVSRGGRDGEGAGSVSRESGGGANFFFGGPKCPPLQSHLAGRLLANNYFSGMWGCWTYMSCIATRAACYRIEKRGNPENGWGRRWEECCENSGCWRECWRGCCSSFLSKEPPPRSTLASTPTTTPKFRSTLLSALPNHFWDFPVSLFCSRPPGSQVLQAYCRKVRTTKSRGGPPKTVLDPLHLWYVFPPPLCLRPVISLEKTAQTRRIPLSEASKTGFGGGALPLNF